jgi:hypothetical protein
LEGWASEHKSEIVLKMGSVTPTPEPWAFAKWEGLASEDESEVALKVGVVTLIP